MTAEQLRAAMSAAGVNSPQLARMLGISPDTVRSWRIGRRTPCCAHMVKAIELALRIKD